MRPGTTQWPSGLSIFVTFGAYKLRLKAGSEIVAQTHAAIMYALFPCGTSVNSMHHCNTMPTALLLNANTAGSFFSSVE